MAKEKKDKKALKNAKKDIWNNYSASEKKALEKLCLNYRHFLSKCKTERECVKEIIFQAQRAGYRDLKDIITNKETLQAGDKVYSVCMNKSVVLFNIGSEPMENGMNILGAHIDSPRLDIKQRWWTCLYGYTLLWWYQKISMGYCSTCYPWRCSQKRWNCS